MRVKLESHRGGRWERNIPGRGNQPQGGGCPVLGVKLLRGQRGPEHKELKSDARGLRGAGGGASRAFVQTSVFTLGCVRSHCRARRRGESTRSNFGKRGWLSCGKARTGEAEGLVGSRGSKLRGSRVVPGRGREDGGDKEWLDSGYILSRTHSLLTGWVWSFVEGDVED